MQVFGAFLYPLALTLQLPVYIYVMVLEKENRLRQMQLSMGLKLNSYYFVNFAYNMALYTGIAAFFWLVGTAVKLRFFVQARPRRSLCAVLLSALCVLVLSSICWPLPQTAWTTLLVLLAGWGLALVATGFVLSAVLSRSAGCVLLSLPRSTPGIAPQQRARAALNHSRWSAADSAFHRCSSRAATVLGYVVVLFGNGVALLLADGIFGDLPGLSLGGRALTLRPNALVALGPIGVF